jgi:hypothetical protein
MCRPLRMGCAMAGEGIGPVMGCGTGWAYDVAHVT